MCAETESVFLSTGLQRGTIRAGIAEHPSHRIGSQLAADCGPDCIKAIAGRIQRRGVVPLNSAQSAEKVECLVPAWNQDGASPEGKATASAYAPTLTGSDAFLARSRWR